MWMKSIRAMRKDLVVICHQEEAKNASGDAYFTLDLPGKMDASAVAPILRLASAMRSARNVRCNGESLWTGG